MPNDMTTARDRFPVIDISHKPKRMQGDSLINAQTVENDSLDSSIVPQILTLERAIKFYEENAKGEYARLYTVTAKWLRACLTHPVKKNVEEVPAPSDVPEDGVDADKAQELLDKIRGKQA